MAGRLAALALVALLVGLLGYGLVTKSPDTGIDEKLAQAQTAPAPRFELAVLQRGALGPDLSSWLAPALRDGRIGSNELRGRPVVLNFWASWCVPCRTEAPVLQRSWLAWRKRRVAFVGLNQQDLTGDARAFMREFHISYLNIRDPTNDVALKYGVTGIPETFFLSASNKVVAHAIGAMSPEELRRGIAAARAGRPHGVIQGGARRPTR